VAEEDRGIHRVLKPGGRFFISDLRRDITFPVRWFLYLNTRPRSIRAGLLTSIGASYTPGEIKSLLEYTSLAGAKVRSNSIGD